MSSLEIVVIQTNYDDFPRDCFRSKICKKTLNVQGFLWLKIECNLNKPQIYPKTNIKIKSQNFRLSRWEKTCPYYIFGVILGQRRTPLRICQQNQGVIHCCPLQTLEDPPSAKLQTSIWFKERYSTGNLPRVLNKGLVQERNQESASPLLEKYNLYT